MIQRCVQQKWTITVIPLSRPCYNAQIAVSDGIIVNADLFQRPGDSKTFIPFMERFKEFRGFYQHMEHMIIICTV